MFGEGLHHVYAMRCNSVRHVHIVPFGHVECVNVVRTGVTPRKGRALQPIVGLLVVGQDCAAFAKFEVLKWAGKRQALHLARAVHAGSEA